MIDIFTRLFGDDSDKTKKTLSKNTDVILWQETPSQDGPAAKWYLKEQSDITPTEVLSILRLVMILQSNPNDSFDISWYIKEHKIGRHFVKEITKLV